MNALRPASTKTKWRNRPAFCLNNGVVELTTLTGGGHIADFRLLDSTGSSVNALWEAPWPTMDPDKFRSSDVRKNVRKYGPTPVGKFLAAFTGHAVCVDYFGGPSDAEAAQGLGLHGEAANSRWKLVESKQTGAEVRLSLAVRLPVAGLRFRRDLGLRRNESVVYVEERLSNERAQDHFFHWTEHVTLGLPLLHPDESIIALFGTRAVTWPHGYEGASLVGDDQEFTWPEARAIDGGKVNLARPFARDGKGFVAAVLLDPQRDVGFVAALNWRLGLLLGYCFRRSDFPWVAIWEENMARTDPPWEGKTRARGLEFGSTPMPVGKEETFARGPLFDTPTFRRIPAKGELRAPYVAFLSKVGSGWRSIGDIQVRRDSILVTEERGEQLELQATGLKRLGLGGQ
ncbi:MAG: hypothetical protein LAO23_02560 [Acidobacteriia bacterium]|nr:hypothetical protein [Terriglobia bacterium]